MKILLAFFCLFIVPNFGSPVQQTNLLGGPKSKECFSGTYWCASLQSAKQCNAIKHCIHAVWEKQHVPEDTDSICKICLDMVQQARDQLESNETQSDLKAVFEGSCKLIPIKSVSNECCKLADNFIPELVEALASQMNPQVVCSTAGLCNNAKIDKLLEEYEAQQQLKLQEQKLEKNLLSCDGCGTIGNIITARFRSSDRDQILNGFLGFCGRMSSFTDACASIVLTYFNEIYQELRENLNAENICHMSGTCADKFHKHEDVVEIKPKSNIGFVKQQVDDDIPCELCQQLVTHLRELLVANTTELEFKQVLQGLCKQFGGFKDECLSIVDQYYSIIYETLVNDLDANGACFMIGICPKKAGDFVSAPVKPLVPAHIQKPKKILGSDEPLFTREEINSFQLPLERVFIGSQIDSLMGAPLALQLVDGGNWCTTCEYIFHFLQDELSLPKNEDEIKKTIEEVCDKLPKFNTNCHEFVDLYGDALIALLVQGIDPREMCPRLKFCPTVKEDVDVFAPSEIDVSINGQKKINACPLCILVVQEIVKTVEDKSSKDEIIAVLDKICNRFTSKFRIECTDFVETYTSELVDKLANNFTPKEICNDLKLCPGNAVEEKPDPVLSGDVETNEIPDDTVGGVHISLLNNPYQATPNCVLCEMVVKEVEKQMTKKTTHEEIISLMKKQCALIKKFKDRCNQLVDDDVEKFLDLMDKVITKELTPKQVCRMLGACFTGEEQDLDIDEALIVNVVAVPAFPQRVEEPELVRVPLKRQGSRVHMVVQIDDDSDMAEKKEEVGDGPECVLCEFVMSKLEDELKNKTTEDEIKSAVLNICHHLPKSVGPQCSKFVNQYADFIIALVTTVSPKEVCQKMSLCPAIEKQMHIVGASECTWGPTHFCSNEEIAEKCKATKYCQEQKVGKWSV